MQTYTSAPLHLGKCPEILTQNRKNTQQHHEPAILQECPPCSVSQADRAFQNWQSGLLLSVLGVSLLFLNAPDSLDGCVVELDRQMKSYFEHSRTVRLAASQTPKPILADGAVRGNGFPGAVLCGGSLHGGNWAFICSNAGRRCL